MFDSIQGNRFNGFFLEWNVDIYYQIEATFDISDVVPMYPNQFTTFDLVDAIRFELT